MNFETDFLAYSLLRIYKNGKVPDFSVVPLFGDASGRSYCRISFENTTVVMMKVADVKPGEFGRGDSFSDFIAIRDFFNGLGIKVPEILAVIPEQKALLLEDLGDLTLFKSIENGGNKFECVKSAVDLLVETQKRLSLRKDFDTPADRRSFTEELFMAEFYHFYEYMIAKRVYHIPYKNLWPQLEKFCSEISKELASLPYFFSHRDFQSKNIMIKDGKYYLIDFQDALTAPVVYDLVSLLRDSYITLTADELSELVRHFWDTNSVVQGLFNDFNAFEHAFYLQTLQRKMKDAGRFVYLNQVKGKEWFVPYILPTLGYVKDAFIKLGFEKTLDILAPYVPEFDVRSSK